jgi:hypothetical protein
MVSYLKQEKKERNSDDKEMLVNAFPAVERCELSRLRFRSQEKPIFLIIYFQNILFETIIKSILLFNIKNF